MLPSTAKVLAAVDRVTKTDSVTAYMTKIDQVAEQVVEGGALGQGILQLVKPGKTWKGTASTLRSDLLRRPMLKPPAHGWPDPIHLSAELTKITPALRKLGIEVTRTRESGPGRVKKITLVRTSEAGTDDGHVGTDEGPIGGIDGSRDFRI